MSFTNVFVYGTLKRGQRNHRLLQGQEYLGTARTVPRYRLYDQGRYPCLVDAPANGVAVTGEIYSVEESVLQKLDELEGVPTLYDRHPVDLVNIEVPVVTYFYKGDLKGLTDCGSEWPPP
jgi:gamma-glutamylaminecyclotransferase